MHQIGVSGQAQSFTASGDEIFKLLHRVGITRQNATTLINYLGDELLPALQEWRPAAAAKPLNLEVFRDCIGLLFAKVRIKLTGKKLSCVLKILLDSWLLWCKK